MHAQSIGYWPPTFVTNPYLLLQDPGNPRSKSIESDVIVSATRVSPKHSCASQNQSSPGGSGSQVQVRRSETLHDVKQLLEPSLNDAAASVYPLDRAASMVSSHPPASPDAAIANGVADVSQSVRRVGVASGSAASAGFSALVSGACIGVFNHLT